MEINKDMERELLDNDSEIKDVKLVGTDGGHVMASKAILSIHSPVFKRMFYGNFREAGKSCDSVKLEYSTSVLWGVVSYCYTNRIGYKWFSEVEEESDAMAFNLVWIREAANFFELPKLYEDITKLLSKTVARIKRYKFLKVVMTELKTLGDTEGDLWLKCVERENELSSILFGTNVMLILFREIEMQEKSEGYTWSNRVEGDILDIAKAFCFSSSLFVQDAVSCSFRCGICSERWNRGMNKLESIISRFDSNGCDSAELSRKCFYEFHSNISDKFIDGFGQVVYLRAVKKAFCPCTKNDEAEIQKFADAVDLESIETLMLASIKPCSLFTKDRLYNALVKRGLKTPPQKRQRKKRN